MNTDGTVDTVELKRIGLVYCERSCTNDQLCKICVRWLSALKYHMYEIQINCYHSDVSYKVFESVGWSNKLSTTKMCLNQTVINVYLFLPIQVPQHWNASSSDWPMAPRLPQSTTVNLQRKAKNREKRRKVESEKKEIWCHSSVFATFSSSAEFSFFLSWLSANEDQLLQGKRFRKHSQN